VIERKAPLAQGRAVLTRVSANLRTSCDRIRAFRAPGRKARDGMALAWAGAAPSHHARRHFRSRSPLVGGGRIGLSPDYQRQALPFRRAPTGIFRCRCRVRHFEAVKRTTCDRLMELKSRDKRARSCGCASCIRCPRSTSATASRRSTEAAQRLTQLPASVPATRPSPK
jgi:hypothetical protein